MRELVSGRPIQRAKLGGKHRMRRFGRRLKQIDILAEGSRSSGTLNTLRRVEVTVPLFDGDWGVRKNVVKSFLSQLFKSRRADDRPGTPNPRSVHLKEYTRDDGPGHLNKVPPDIIKVLSYQPLIIAVE